MKSISAAHTMTFLRILSVPVLLYFAFQKNVFAFGVVFVFAGLTDALDGYFSRKKRTVSDFGSRFDTFADFCLALPVLVGIYLMFPQIFETYVGYIIALIAVALFSRVIQLIKHQKLIAFHLYSDKLAGVIAYVFLAYTFLKGFNEIFFFIAWGMLFICQTEEALISLSRKKIPQQIKHIFQKS